MDKDRFQHIVDENKSLRDQYISELVSHTMNLQKQVIKSRDPGFFKRFGNTVIEAINGNETAQLMCFVVIPICFIVLSWSSYGIFRCVIDDIRETATGTWVEEKEPVPDYTPVSFSLAEEDGCHTIMTRLKGGSYHESSCIEDPYDALMVIRDLQSLQENKGKTKEAFVSTPRTLETEAEIEGTNASGP